MPAARPPMPLLLLALAAATTAAQAQPAPLPMAQAELHRQIVLGDGFGPQQWSFSDRAPERVIKGAPYCAEAQHETSQWLTDAGGAANNRIVTRQGTRLCRDGEGRTRQEIDRGDRKLVVLRDPVAHEAWVIDLERKTARRMAEGPWAGAGEDPGGPGWRAYAERMRDWARDVAERTRGITERVLLPAGPAAPLVPPVPPEPPAPVVITRPDAGAPGGGIQIIRVPRGDGLALAGDLAVPPPAVQGRAQALAPRGAGSTSPLGSRDIEGVTAHGERTTWLIEAGKIGNERPIQITHEVWTAPELMVTLQSRDFDPRSGEVSYRLTNLKRGEPDPAWMRVPADFKKIGGVALRGVAPASGGPQ